MRDAEYEAMDDKGKFAYCVTHVLQEACEFVNHWFGIRCPDFDENCECCKRWKLYDELAASGVFANPFANDQERLK